MTSADWQSIRAARPQQGQRKQEDMSRTFVKRSNVDDELTEIFCLIAQDKIEPAERFLVVAEESFRRLAQTPHLGCVFETQRPRLAGIRFYPMPSPYRNYLIFYRILPDVVDIIKVVAGMRNLEFVMERTLS